MSQVTNVVPVLALFVSLCSLALAAAAFHRARRGEKLQRGRLEVIAARAGNLYEGGEGVFNVTLKNLGRDAVTIAGFGIGYWLEKEGSEPLEIAVIPKSYQLTVGEDRLFQDRLYLEPTSLRRIIDGDDTLCIGIRVEFLDAIGPQIMTWVGHHASGRVDILDKIEPRVPMPSFLQRPIYP